MNPAGSVLADGELTAEAASAALQRLTEGRAPLPGAVGQQAQPISFVLSLLGLARLADPS
jgi:hypothetical protein